MRTIVVNCDAQWDDWPRQLRTRAIDLYPAHEGVEFWMLGKPSHPAQSRIWGDWPRFIPRGAAGLLGELGDAIQALDGTGADRLAIILVLGHPSEMAAGDAQPTDIPGMLRRLAEERIRDRALRATQLVRILAFRRGAEDRSPATLQAALAALAGGPDQPGRADAAVFLTPPEMDDERALNAASVRVFDSLRVLIDLVRDSDEAGDAGPGWDLLRSSPAAGSMALWLKPPAEGRVRADPSAELRARIAAFVQRRQNEQGTDVIGQAMQDLKGLEETIRAFIASGRTMEATERKGEALQALDEPPETPDLAAVDGWRDAVQETLNRLTARIWVRVEQSLRAQEQFLLRQSQAMEEKARRISIVSIGLTDQAQRTLDELLALVARERLQAARLAEKSRDAIIEDAQKLRFGAGAASLGGETARRHAALQEETARQVPLRIVGGVVLTVAACFYALLALHTRALVPPDAGLGAIVALNGEPLRWQLLGGFIGLGLLFGGLRQRKQQARWAARRAEAQAAVERLAEAVDALAWRAAEYAERSAIGGDLGPLEQRLRQMRDDLAPPGLRKETEFAQQITMLDRSRPRLPLAEMDRVAFETRMRGVLLARRLDDWLALIMAEAEAPPAEVLKLDFGDWRAELRLRSRLRLAGEPVLQVERLAPQGRGGAATCS